MIAARLAPFALVGLLAASCGDNDKTNATPATAANAPKIEVGRQADFIGHLVLTQANDAGHAGVRGKSGQAMLQNQGVFVIVSVGDLKLH
jgi:hypothetical protein